MGFWEALQWLAEKWWLWAMVMGIWVIMTLMLRGKMSLFGAIGTGLILPIMGTLVTANAINSVAMAARWLPDVVARNRAKSAEFDDLCLDLEGLFDAPPKWLSSADGGEIMTPPDGSDPNQGGGQYDPGYDPNTSMLPADQNPHTLALEPESEYVEVPDFETCVWNAYKAAEWSRKIQMNSSPPWGTELTDWSDQEILVLKYQGNIYYLFSAPWPGAVKVERVLFTRWSAKGIEIGPESAKAAMEKVLGRTIESNIKEAYSVLGTGVLPPQCYNEVPAIAPTAIPMPPAQQQQAPAPVAPTSTPGIPVVEPVFN